MTADVTSVEAQNKLQRVLELMVAHRMENVPVIDSSRSQIGIIAREDVMKAMERSVKRQYPPFLPFETA